MTTVRYPARAAQALGFLKAHSNDVDIFVEDTSAPSMWLKILRKFLPAGTRLKSVTPLGGREAVIKACKADQSVTGRRRLYIIDADMDVLLGKPKPSLKHLYRLRRYCIENYLLSQGALQEVLMSLSPNRPADAIREASQLSSWLVKNETHLRSLFVAYAVASKLSLGVQTVKYSCHQLFLNRVDFDFCSSLVKKRVFAIYRQALSARGSSDVREVYKSVHSSIASKVAMDYASAKNYIFPAIYERAKRNVGMSVNVDIFKTMLCDHIQVSVDPYLKRRLAGL